MFRIFYWETYTKQWGWTDRRLTYCDVAPHEVDSWLKDDRVERIERMILKWCPRREAS